MKRGEETILEHFCAVCVPSSIVYTITVESELRSSWKLKLFLRAIITLLCEFKFEPDWSCEGNSCDILENVKKLHFGTFDKLKNYNNFHFCGSLSSIIFVCFMYWEKRSFRKTTLLDLFVFFCTYLSVRRFFDILMA